ncbi:hypothetical protein JJC03_09950 [Flavobacterium oreochromis]|nr:hypothetical protein [Flavobacterium oreochromis]QYS85535.1 hypothetical protein JJC03_09950 [Flavobacterium oreochromis]
MLGVFIFVKKYKFDFNGLDNGIPVHKYSKEFKELGGHGNHLDYNDISKLEILEIKKHSLDENGMFSQVIFDKKLMNHINKTREGIIQQVIKENKKVNDLDI